MISELRLFPVYEENSNTAAFFVSPAVIHPVAIDYQKSDRHNRKFHLTQYLQLPLNVPNYLALCETPGQVRWSSEDEIDGSAIMVESLIVSAKVEGEEKVLFVQTSNMGNSLFGRTTMSPSQSIMHLVITDYDGFSFENSYGDKIGKSVFSNFKDFGYVPLFKISLRGVFDLQRGSLILKDFGSEFTGVRNLETGVVIKREETSQETLKLMKSIENVFIGGVKVQQMLK